MSKENDYVDETPKSTPGTSANDSTASESASGHQLSETWAHDTVQELDDWIESQGIYLRQ